MTHAQRTIVRTNTAPRSRRATARCTSRAMARPSTSWPMIEPATKMTVIRRTEPSVGSDRVCP